jgi:hypothetical protein
MAAIPPQAAEGDIDATSSQGQRAPLLVSTLVHTGWVHLAAHSEPARPHVDADQHMFGSSGLGHGEDQPCPRIVDRRAGDAQWVNVPARQGRHRYRRSHGDVPLHLPSSRVERIDRIVFGDHQHMAIHYQRIGIDCPVEFLRPEADES